MTAPKQPGSALNAATVALSLIVGGLGVWTVFAGPTELLPVHYNAAGQADDWGGRELVGGVLIAMAALTLALGGNTSMPMRRHSAIKMPTFSVSWRSTVSRAAMYSTG